MAESVTVTESVKHNVVIANSAGDNTFARELSVFLKSEHFSVCHLEDDIKYGENKMEKCLTEMHNSSKILLVVTKESVWNAWCTFQMVVAMENFQKSKVMSVVLVLKDISDDEILNNGLLHIAPKVYVDIGEEYKEKLLGYLRGQTDVQMCVSMEHMAHGLAWSHFNGVLKDCLPVFYRMVQESEFGKKPKFPIRLYEMVPKSCNTSYLKADATNLPRVKFVGFTATHEYWTAGNKRIVKFPVYELRDPDGQLYYCAAEHPSVIKTIKHMADRTNDDNRWLEVGRFHFTMNMILNHPSMSNCKKRAQVVLFDDTGEWQKENIADLLISAIKEDLDPEAEITNQMASLMTEQADDIQHDVYLCCSDTDKQVKGVIKKHLEENDLRVYDEIEFGKSVFNVEHFRCTWFVIVLSKATMKDEKFMSFRQMCFVKRAVDTRKLRVVPVIVDLHDYEIPQWLSWITYIQKNESNPDYYLESLCRVLKGGEIPLDSKTFLPLGNVAKGLALGYAANYLNFVLPDLVQTVEKTNGKYSIRCPLKLYVIFPKSCSCPPQLSNERIEAIDQAIVLFEIGQRKYECGLYKVTSNGKEQHHFLGLYSAALRTLRDMAQLNIGDMDRERLLEQGDVLQSTTEMYLDAALAQNCRFIQYDDRRLQLADVLVRCILEDLNERNPGVVNLYRRE